VVRNGWQVHELQAHLPVVRLPAGLDDLAADWGSWFAGTGIPAGTPFLISPDMQYDVVANAFFASTDMLMLARTTSWDTPATSPLPYAAGGDLYLNSTRVTMASDASSSTCRLTCPAAGVRNAARNPELAAEKNWFCGPRTADLLVC
jgi:hypothetical protein